MNQKLIDIASYCSDEVVVSENMGCCGMAGDRGLLFPGLTQKATMKESEELKNVMADGYYSSNIPCENAMTSAVNKRYLSIAYLVDRVSG